MQSLEPYRRPGPPRAPQKHQGAFLALVLGLAGLTASSCGPPPPVVVSAGNPFFESADITMSQEDAALAKQLRAAAPKRDARFGECHYWLDRESDAPADRLAVRQFVETEARLICAFWRSQDQDMRKLSETGGFAADMTLEKNGDIFTGIDVALTWKGRPAANTPLTIMTAPEFEGHKKQLAKVTDDAGKVRIDAAEAKAELFGDWFPGPPDHPEVAGMIIRVDDQRIPITEQVRPIYTAWVMQAAGQQQARDVDAKAIAEQEIKAGRCTDARATKVQNVAMTLSDIFDGMTSGSDVYKVVGKKIVVATDQGTSVALDAGTGGNQHLFAVAFGPVRLDLKDATGYAVPTKSPYEPIVRENSGGMVDSRNFRTQMGDQLSVRVIGAGCTLLLTVKQL